MFIGSINTKVRSFLALSAGVFDERTAVVGCSGNFTSEAVLCSAAKPLAIHSNDISLYSCLAGAYLLGQEMAVEVADPEYQMIGKHLTTMRGRLATVMVLLEMLPYEKRQHATARRMWPIMWDSFDERVEATAEKMAGLTIRIDSFTAGDVFDHFVAHEGDEDPIFCCYAPTYSGGYERMYKRLEQVLRWPAPSYPRLDDKRRDQLLTWMAERDYVWYDDRPHKSLPLVMEQRSKIGRTVYIYSNLPTFKAYVGRAKTEPVPKLPLGNSEMTLTGSETVRLQQITTSQMAAIKDMFLGKNIDHAQGVWAFAVWVGAWVVGFLEFREDRATRGPIYMLADLAVPNTVYKRLSKLMPMLACSNQTKRLIERLQEFPCHLLMTTAFTNRPVSMKYRGVMELVKRGTSQSGQKTLSYESKFTPLSWQETYQLWTTQHLTVITPG